MSEALRFLVDHNVGKPIATYLIGCGYDAVFVGDRDPHMSDVGILDWAVRERRIIITRDHDFGSLVHQSGHDHMGVLLLRMGHARRQDRIDVLAWILSNHAHDLPGCFCVYERGRLRIRC